MRPIINKIENGKIMKEINETKNQFFEKIHEVDKSLAMITKDKRKNTQFTKITNEGRVITVDQEMTT